MLYRELEIAGVKLSSPFVLAPLAGFTDLTMRELCEKQGASMTYTEMVSAKGLYYGDRGTEKLLYITESAGPTAIQIFGSEPEIIAYAARKLDSRRNVILDINMGCPVRKVFKNGDGAALMRDPELVYKVVKAAAVNTEKPVTVKIRKGVDQDSVNARDVAVAAESGGASAITVHGRTREQYYSGDADWDIISAVKKAVSIPVIGNGDVKSGEDGVRMMDYTGCDFVMVGRAAIGNPWIFRDLIAFLKTGNEPPVPSITEISDMMSRHFDGLMELKGEYSAVREMRKHAVRYTKGMRGSSKFRALINTIDNAADMRKAIRLDV